MHLRAEQPRDDNMLLEGEAKSCGVQLQEALPCSCPTQREEFKHIQLHSICLWFLMQGNYLLQALLGIGPHE